MFKGNNIYKILLLISVILIAILMSRSCVKENEYERREKSISALNDSIKVIINKKSEKEFHDNIPQMTVKEILNSEEFKNLTKTQQEFYKELKGQKNLIAALRQEIVVRDSIIQNLSYEVSSLKPHFTDSSVCFDYGSKLDLSDTTKKNMKYNLFLSFNKDSIKKDFKYEYKLTAKNTWSMDKKKNILVKTEFDDKNAVLEKNDGLLIPYNEMGRNKFEKWMNKNRTWVKWVERGAIFFLGTQVK